MVQKAKYTHKERDAWVEKCSQLLNQSETYTDFAVVLTFSILKFNIKILGKRLKTLVHLHFPKS